jgi:hypothetical protein
MAPPDPTDGFPFLPSVWPLKRPAFTPPVSRSWPLGLASTANRPIIELVFERSGLTGCFRTTVSSEEVARGKPAPDVYLEAAARLGVPPERCAAAEDSPAACGRSRPPMVGGGRAQPPLPPAAEPVQAADLVLTDLRELRRPPRRAGERQVSVAVSFPRAGQGYPPRERQPGQERRHAVDVVAIAGT